MLVKDITNVIEDFAPLQYQESYDNAGLCIGNPENKVSGVLICIDITEEVLNEAVELGCNLIISHHPLIFSGLKKITAKNYTERCVIFAIKNNLNIYSAHTNADAVVNGVSMMMAEKMGLKNCGLLQVSTGNLLKIVTYVPREHADKVRQAMFEAGGGHIGNYSSCSYNIEGHGTFLAEENSDPFIGEKGKIHIEPEVRIEIIAPKHAQNRIINAMNEAHPYEEVAFDIFTLENQNPQVGMGIIGELDKPAGEKEFLASLKKIFSAEGIRHTRLLNKKIKKVALCGGSGSSLLNLAIGQNADVFVSADFKYHQFFDAGDKILIADIGHYESEQFTKEIFYNLLVKKFPKFAVHFSKVNTNPINYL